MWSVANVEMLPIANVANCQLVIGHWKLELATLATFQRTYLMGESIYEE